MARPYWPHIGGVFLLSLLSTPLSLLGPVPLMIAVDSVIGSRPLPGLLVGLLPAAVSGYNSLLLLLAAAMVIVIALMSRIQGLCTTMLRTYAGEKLGRGC